MTTIFASFIDDVIRGNISILGGTFKMLLVTDRYTPDETGHTRRSDITDEAIGEGYTEGGISVELSVISDTSNSTTNVRIAQVDFENVTIGARGCVVYCSRGGAATEDELVCYGDFGSVIDVEVGTLSVASADIPFRVKAS